MSLGVLSLAEGGMTKKICLLSNSVANILQFRLPLLMALKEKGYIVLVCSPKLPSDDINLVLKMGIQFYSVPYRRVSINPLGDLLLFFRFILLLKKTRPNILLAFTIKPVIYGTLAAFFAGVIERYVVVTGLGHVFIGQGLKLRLINKCIGPIYKIALTLSRRVIFQNPDDCDMFIQRGLVRRDKTGVVNGSGVAINYFKPAPFPRAISFLFMARLIEEKGILEYVEAARRIKKSCSSARFAIVGGLDENPSSIKQNILYAWEKEGVVEYLGKLDDVRPAITESAVFVLPSYREGIPRAVLEAMAMGRPIITTNAPGCRETVQEGRNGFLVPIKNVEKLVEAMERFILHPEIIPIMGRESRKIAESKYDVHKVNQEMLRIMDL